MISLILELKNPEYRTADGQTASVINEPASVVVMEPTECQHEETVCEECSQDWASDWDLLGAILYTADGAVEVEWEEWP